MQRLDLTVAAPCRCPQTAKHPAPCHKARGEEGEKSDSFSRESEQDRSPFLGARERQPLENVPVEHFQRHKRYNVKSTTSKTFLTIHTHFVQ
jgi:hypothetical protein